jgi:hypothetical protein
MCQSALGDHPWLLNNTIASIFTKNYEAYCVISTLVKPVWPNASLMRLSAL